MLSYPEVACRTREATSGACEGPRPPLPLARDPSPTVLFGFPIRTLDLFLSRNISSESGLDILDWTELDVLD